MKKLLILAVAVITVITTASAQLPTLTGATKFKATKANETWNTTLDDIKTYVNTGSGTVTSVDVSGGSTGLTTSGGPVTTSGTITVAGTLDADNGGTGFASYTVGDLLQANTTSTLAKLAAVATGNVLISGGVGTVSSWGKVGLTTHISGTLGIANGGTNLTAVGGDGTILGSDGAAALYLSPAITTNAAAIAYARSGSNLNLNLPNADASNRGTVSTTTQTFAGAKTFNALITAGAGVTSTSAAGAAAFFATGVTGGSWVQDDDGGTLDETHNFVQVHTLSEAETYNLPACNATRSGWEYTFHKTGADTFGLVIDPNGSETFVDGASTKTLYSQNQTATCKCKWNGSTGTWYFAY
jgi:hypothetical protein